MSYTCFIHNWLNPFGPCPNCRMNQTTTTGYTQLVPDEQTETDAQKLLMKLEANEAFLKGFIHGLDMRLEAIEKSIEALGKRER